MAGVALAYRGRVVHERRAGPHRVALVAGVALRGGDDVRGGFLLRVLSKEAARVTGRALSI